MHTKSIDKNLEKLLLPISQMIWLRWTIMISIPLIAISSYFATRISISLTELLILIFLAVLGNSAVLHLATRKNSDTLKLFKTALLLDITILSLFLFLYGGPANPFSILYLVEIAVAAMVLSTRWIWIITSLCWIGFGSTFVMHRALPEISGHNHSDPFSLHLYGMWFAFVIASSLIAFFVSKLTATLIEQYRIINDLHINASHQQRLAALTTLSAGAAHELNTPLGTILVAVESMLNGIDSIKGSSTNFANWLVSSESDLELVKGEVERCSSIIRRMSGWGVNASLYEPSEFSWGDLKNELHDFFSSRELVITDDLNPNINLKCSRNELVQALSCVIKNGLESQEDSDHPISLKASINSHSKVISFTISDKGAGIAPEHLPHIGEPFFSTKEPGKGLGLGLFLVRLFVLKLGGSISIDSQTTKTASIGSDLDNGTTIILNLPILT